jgi:hypothetical protein
VTCFTKADNSFVSTDPQQPAQFTFPQQVHARYLRIIQIGHGVMHLRRIRVLGFDRAAPVPAAPAPAEPVPDAPAHVQPPVPPAETMSVEALTATIEAVVQQRVLGRLYDSYNIDTLAFLSAGIDSGLYALSHMVSAKRFAGAWELRDHAASCAPASGMVLEFGVFSGRSINQVAGRMPGRKIYGFDSFKGLPEAWRPGFDQGAFSVAVLPAVADNVELVVGWFDATLPGFLVSHPDEKLALLHVDCDLYSSTKTVFGCLADRMVPGTIIIFDEYFNYPEWRLHEYKAFQELCHEHAIAYDYIGLVPSHQQVAVRVTGIG